MLFLGSLMFFLQSSDRKKIEFCGPVTVCGYEKVGLKIEYCTPYTRGTVISRVIPSNIQYPLLTIYFFQFVRAQRTTKNQFDCESVIDMVESIEA